MELAQHRQCLHSRKLVALSGMNELDKEDSFLVTHLKECTSCQVHHKKQLDQQSKISSNIPFQQLQEEDSVFLDNEITEIVKNISLRKMNRSKKESKKIKIKLSGKSTFKTLFSFSMIKIYIIAGAGFMILQKIIH